MFDNFSLISPLLFFTPNSFYFVQIIKRRKDNPGMKNDVSIKDRLFLYNENELFELKEKIITSCNFYNARAYITLNPRSLEKVAFETLRQIAEHISKKEYKAVKNACYSACGQYASEKKYWFVDVDEKDLDKYDEIQNELGINFVGKLPSKSGFHLITKPFDPREFYKKFPGIQLEKDGATNLYIP